MGYGFKALNGSDEVLIDQDYVNPMLFKYGTKTMSYGSTPSVSFTGRTNPPLVAVSPRTGQPIYVGLSHITTSGGLYNAVKFMNSQSSSSGISYNVDYAFFDEVGGIGSGGNWGMKVFDGSGNVTYDSRNAYMEIVDVVSVPDPILADMASHSYSHTSLANAYYVINSLTGIVIVPSSGIGMILSRGVKQSSNTSVTVGYGPIGLASGVDVGTDTRVATDILVCKRVLI